MDTKLVGDIAVQHAILASLERGWAVSVPVGDRLPYDLVLDVRGRMLRIQVKSAYYVEHRTGGYWAAGVRRCKTNRRVYRIEYYQPADFDFALIWHPGDRLFYVLPITDFLTWRSDINLTRPNRTLVRTKRADKYRDAWHLIGSGSRVAPA